MIMGNGSFYDLAGVFLNIADLKIGNRTETFFRILTIKHVIAEFRIVRHETAGRGCFSERTSY